VTGKGREREREREREINIAKYAQEHFRNTVSY
jgi:hypothetical protein